MNSTSWMRINFVHLCLIHLHLGSLALELATTGVLQRVRSNLIFILPLRYVTHLLVYRIHFVRLLFFLALRRLVQLWNRIRVDVKDLVLLKPRRARG